MENIFSLHFIRGNKMTEESKLIKKAKKGDSKSFTELIKLYKVYLYKTAYIYVKDEHKALEILQETTYKAFKGINKLKDLTLFKTWITRIIINTSLSMIKKEDNITYLDNDTPLIYSEKGISIEEKLDLYNAIELLRDKYKTVIILKYFNDVSIEDISYIMDIPQNTVKSHLRRAKESLSKILREDYLNE